MKKNKSKIVLFSVIGLAAISIGTVGFATWITGIKKETMTDNLTIEVDNSKNDTVLLDATLSSKQIVLKESVKGQEYLNTDNTDVSPVLSLNFTTFIVTTSKDYTFNGVNVALSFAGDVTDVAVDSDINSIYPKKLFNGSDNTTSKSSYITLGKNKFASSEFKTITETSDTNYIEGYNTYEFTTKKLEFSWGSMFNYRSPCTFYNSPSPEPGNNKEKLQYMENANKTLQKLYKDLGGKTITLTLTADVTANPKGE